MKEILLLFFLFIIGIQLGYSQRTCGSIFNLNDIRSKNTTRYQRIIQMENHLKQYNERLLKGKNENIPAVIRIPVVVHVLHNGESIGTGQNISMIQIESQIEVLNEDFRRQNANASNTPSSFIPVAADPEFEFFLACIDPDGNPTNGIVRQHGQSNYIVVLDSNGEIDEFATGIKLGSNGSPAWPTDKYLNIWVCDLANILGYAQFPDQFYAKPNTDGIVVTTTAFGRTGNVSAPYHLGRTATHEIGHWLNLQHIWGDYDGCGGQGDFVNDTPDQKNEYYGCPSFPQTSCGSNDMFMNYMDYTDDGCMNIFTIGQRNRMRALFALGGERRSFIQNAMSLAISGPEVFCGIETYTINTSFPVSWSASPSGIVNLSSAGNSVTVSKISSGDFTLSAQILICDETLIILKEISTEAKILAIDVLNRGCYELGYEDWHISASPSFPTGTSNWQWKIDDPNNTGNIIIHTPNSKSTWVSVQGGGGISVTYTDPCGQTSRKDGITVYNSNCTSSSFTISPNPAIGMITIKTENEQFNSILADINISKHNAIDKITIFNYYGKKVIEQQFRNNSTSVQMDVSSLFPGMYFVQLGDGPYSEMEKLIVGGK